MPPMPPLKWTGLAAIMSLTDPGALGRKGQHAYPGLARERYESEAIFPRRVTVLPAGDARLLARRRCVRATARARRNQPFRRLLRSEASERAPARRGRAAGRNQKLALAARLWPGPHFPEWPPASRRDRYPQQIRGRVEAARRQRAAPLPAYRGPVGMGYFLPAPLTNPRFG
jgi:hypothetical protein